MIVSLCLTSWLRKLWTNSRPVQTAAKPSPHIGLMLKTGGTTEKLNGYEDINYDVLDGPGRERVVVISWVHRTCKEEPEPLALQDYPH